jgi:hypothetical protein
MLRKLSSLLILALPFLVIEGSLAYPRGVNLGTPKFISDKCGGNGYNRRPGPYQKVEPGYPPGTPDKVVEYVGMDEVTKKYPAEYAWANRQVDHASSTCLGDQYGDLRKVGFERKFPVFCGELILLSGKGLSIPMIAPQSEKYRCDLKIVPSGLMIGNAFFDANKKISWFPADEPTLSSPGTVITESDVICRDGMGSNNAPMKTFFINGYDRDGSNISVKFNAWQYRCMIEQNFVELIGRREQFDTSTVTYPVGKTLPKVSATKMPNNGTAEQRPKPPSSTILKPAGFSFGGI